tara:strand:+ start:1411 stop:1674 length:264 start_codon:yes stop_codon:yes gene_type:complete
MNLKGVATCIVMAAPHRPVCAWIILIGNRELIRFVGTNLQSALLAGPRHRVADASIPEQLITHAWIHGSGSSTVNGCAGCPCPLHAL